MIQRSVIQSCAAICLIEQRIGQLSFFLLQEMNPLLDRAFAEQLVYKNGLVLANAVSAISRLSFRSWIPPGVVVNDGIRRSKIQPCATRFERDEK